MNHIILAKRNWQASHVWSGNVAMGGTGSLFLWCETSLARDGMQDLVIEAVLVLLFTSLTLYSC